MDTKLTRKRGQILAAGYGHIWPLDRHEKGYCLILNPDTQVYVWAEKRAALHEFVAAYVPSMSIVQN